MPLDPQAEAFLRQVAKSNAPPLHELAPEQARAQMAPAPQPFEPIGSVTDLRAPGPDGDIPVRVYVPAAEREDELPALVYFHGGGWVMGSLDAYEGLCRSLANAACAVVISVDYRLAPEHRYPAAVEDAYAATWWVHEPARTLGVDPARLAVGGDSAGGNLAAAVCLMARDRGRPALSAQVLLYPILDHAFDTASYRENGEGYYLTRAAMEWFWKLYLAREEDGAHPYASPLRAERLTGLPPALIVTAEYDPLRDEGEAYARRLESEGVAVRLIACHGMIHGFLRRPDTFAQTRPTISQIGQALRERWGIPGRAASPG